MKRYSLDSLILGALLLTSCQIPQSVELRSVGAELQVYPAGGISTATAAWSECNEKEVRLHAGWNETDREDFGKHDDERGGGPGFGVSARRYWGKNLDGWFVGARTDLWFLDIDWTQSPGTPAVRRGSTDVLVLQPTVLGGYRWRLGESNWNFEVSLSGGAEINLSTAGENVGEGAIGLLGVALSYSL